MLFQSLVPFVAIALALVANGAPAIDPIFARGNALGYSHIFDARNPSGTRPVLADIYRRKQSNAQKQRKQAARLRNAANAANPQKLKPVVTASPPAETHHVPLTEATLPPHPDGVPGEPHKPEAGAKAVPNPAAPHPDLVKEAEEKKKEEEKKLNPATSTPGGPHTEVKAGEVPAHTGSPAPPGEHPAPPKTMEEEEKEAKEKADREAKEKAANEHPTEPTADTAPKPGKTEALISGLNTVTALANTANTFGSALHPGAASTGLQSGEEASGGSGLGGMGGISGMGGMGGMT
ncbi:hypothetical protein C8R41DRAFT_508850 [Lentinula lateritia]|uniref:Uncharacterized protein n=1 Tax=Lentinula lateritia TaxID=40482 RepID=A0ABQ8V7T4_9AGAR|nr:hypothetical protein C8R41DRAFT_508850 [Lentinula lateritia]